MGGKSSRGFECGFGGFGILRSGRSRQRDCLDAQAAGNRRRSRLLRAQRWYAQHPLGKRYGSRSWSIGDLNQYDRCKTKHGGPSRNSHRRRRDHSSWHCQSGADLSCHRITQGVFGYGHSQPDSRNLGELGSHGLERGFTDQGILRGGRYWQHNYPDSKASLYLLWHSNL